MDQGKAIKIAKQFVGSLSGKYTIKRAFLFGSFAKGGTRKDSDIDIALVFASCKDVFGTRIDLMNIRRDIDLRIEPHPFDEGDFKEGSSLIAEIKKYGIPL